MEVRKHQLKLVAFLLIRMGRDWLGLLDAGILDPHPEVRVSALQLSAKMKDERAIGLVASMLTDSSRRVRKAAIRCIRRTSSQDSTTMGPVLRVFQNRTNRLSERLAGVKAVMYRHRLLDIQLAPLDSMRSCDDRAFLTWGAKALLYFEDGKYTSVLVHRELQASVSRNLELTLLWVLAELGEGEGLDLLTDALHCGVPDIQEKAAYGWVGLSISLR